jgi:hypothetical protein
MDLLVMWFAAIAGLCAAAIAFPRARNALVPMAVLVAVLPPVLLLVLFWIVLSAGGHGIG